MKHRSRRLSSSVTFRLQTPAIESEETILERVLRRRVFAEYLNRAEAPTAESAWRQIYELLLWIDPQTGVVSCSAGDAPMDDRCASRLHEWLAEQFGVASTALSSRLDFIFRYVRGESTLRRSYLEQWPTLNAVGRCEHPERNGSGDLNEVIKTALRPYFLVEPPASAFTRVSTDLSEYWKQENKRKNLLGEGFEDVLAATVNAACGGGIMARTRISIAEVAGFHALGAKDKATKVDLVIENPTWSRPALVNVKWSIRADREDQLWDDFKEYVRFDRDQRGFDHYLVTNEFDPARLNAVCDRREANHFIFKHVVHINTDGVLAAYGPPLAAQPAGKAGKPPRDSSMELVRQQVHQNRLVSLSKWLIALGANG
jgi:hypothetical protein